MFNKLLIAGLLSLTLLLGDGFTSNTEAKVNSVQELNDVSIMLTCRTKFTKEQISGGSGTIIYHEPGQPWVILTAAHVALSCKHDLTATIYRTVKDKDGNEYKSMVLYVKTKTIAAFPQKDIAILETETKFDEQSSYVSLAKASPTFTNSVWTAGYPSPFRNFIMSKGTVNAPDVKIKMCKFPKRTLEELEDLSLFELNKYWDCYPSLSEDYIEIPYILSDAPIYYGNSGGALVNKNLELVGVNVMMVRMGNLRALSVPIETVRDLINTTKYGNKIFKKQPDKGK